MVKLLTSWKKNWTLYSHITMVNDDTASVVNNVIMNVYTPQTHPDFFEPNLGSLNIFLAGTIDSGDSVNWQDQVISALKDRLRNNTGQRPVNIFNPRRENWNKSASDEDVAKQIRWEHNYLDLCDVVVFNLEPGSMSPISLLELGTYHEKTGVVRCDSGFYRFTNVDVFCQKYGIKRCDTLQEMIDATLSFCTA